MSLAATISKPASVAALKKQRPILPNPLIPIRDTIAQPHA